LIWNKCKGPDRVGHTPPHFAGCLLPPSPPARRYFEDITVNVPLIAHTSSHSLYNLQNKSPEVLLLFPLKALFPEFGHIDALL